MSRLTHKVDDAYYVKEARHLYEDTWELIQKLGKYEDLEDQLGIDLLTLFKAIYKGIWFDDCYDLKKNFTSRPRLYYSDDFKCYCFEISFGSWVVKLKDYKKTWALCKEDLEDD